MTAGLRKRVAAAAADRTVVDAVHLATWRKVDARAASFAALPHAGKLRDHADQIRRHTLAHLPHYLRQFTDQARNRGAHVHFAATAADACELATDIATHAATTLAVKAKSMTTEEIELNTALAAAGVRVVETDLGEFIVQLDHDKPSHIITPIIHKNRRQVARAMARELGTPYTEDPDTLAQQARSYLRQIFHDCDLGITGANFAIAESGTLVLLTNEGNGRMTTTRPRVHIALVGIEKLLPRLSDLGVLLKLLARSSTGQPLGSYTTLITGPRRPDDRDGPDELHVIFVDNGRSDILTGPHADVLRASAAGPA
jgi:L-lactate dehydrogenase complex protein LldF